jgi:DNA-directed RNA polymerase subunit RPC12/RpoP
MTDPQPPQSSATALTYPCGGCGARVQYSPGTQVLRCPYCGYEQHLAPTGGEVREIPIGELATLPRKPVGSIGAYVFVCQRCAARTESNETAGVCQFCGAPVVLDAAATGQILPEAVLPFQIDPGGVRHALHTWASSRWFAPSALKKVSETETAKGTYVPHWTFDSDTVSRYTGARGTHYYTTETYQDNNGQTQTRQVQHTRWTHVDGMVSRVFDDVLIPASGALPAKQLGQMSTWPLTEGSPYRPEYLAGYHALRYDTEPETGLEEAKNRMAKVIHQDCRHDIGGDEQRVESVQTEHRNVTFKLMLLPIWIATYLYGGKSWQVLVNGWTGEIHGERPYSKLKVTLAIVVAVLIVAAVVVGVVLSQHHGH